MSNHIKTMAIGEPVPIIESDKTVNHWVDLMMKKSAKNKARWMPASDHPWRRSVIGKSSYAILNS